MNISKTPQFQSFQLGEVKHITPKDAFEAMDSDEAFIIDVRELSETQGNYIPHENVFFQPVSLINQKTPKLPKDILLIIACENGIRSVRVAEFLEQQGFTNVANLDGGLTEWKEQGLIFEFSDSVFSSCGCGCNEKDENTDSGCGSGCGTGCC